MIEQAVLVLAVTTAYGLLFLAIELLSKGTSASAEAVRKLGHILAGLLAVSFPLFLTYQDIALVGVLLVIAAAVAISRRLFTSVRKVARATYGELLFPLGIAAVALLFPDQLLYTYAILTLTLADALAGILGVAFGRTTYKFLGSKKSYVGSMTFLVVTTAIGITLLVAMTDASYMMSVVIAVVAASLLTLVEAASGYGVDNVSVPLAAASLLWLAQQASFFS